MNKNTGTILAYIIAVVMAAIVILVPFAVLAAIIRFIEWVVFGC